MRRVDRGPDLERARQGSAASLRSVPTGSGSVSSVSPQVKMHIVEPRSFAEAQAIADKFKQGIPVIMNLTMTKPDLAKRLLDFASGLTYGLDGGLAEGLRQGVHAHAAQRRGLGCRSPAPAEHRPVPGRVTWLREALGELPRSWRSPARSPSSAAAAWARRSSRGLLAAGSLEPSRSWSPSRLEARRVELAAHGVRVVAGWVGGTSGRRRRDSRRQAAGDGRGRSWSRAAPRPSVLIVSIAAGISCARLESLLPEGTAVVRVMPNTPAMVGEGMASSAVAPMRPLPT